MPPRRTVSAVNPPYIGYREPCSYRVPTVKYLVVLDECVDRLEQQLLLVSTARARRQEATLVLHHRSDRNVSEEGYGMRGTVVSW